MTSCFGFNCSWLCFKMKPSGWMLVVEAVLGMVSLSKEGKLSLSLN